MKPKIHYICEYGGLCNDRKVSFSPAGLTKMNYIIDTLAQADRKVCVYSMSRLLNADSKIKGACHIKSGGVDYKFRSSFLTKGKVFFHIERFYAYIQLFIYLFFTVKRDDTAVVYHERYYLPVMRLLKRLRPRVNLIYEIEELYTIAAGSDERSKKAEIGALKGFDKYILSNETIADLLGLESGCYSVCNGVYRSHDLSEGHKSDGKIHAVYAGTLDTNKGGAANAVKASEFLSGSFVIHILGFGSERETEELHKLISEVSSGACQVIYEGCKTGDEYSRFLMDCNIGLSTQNPEGEYNNTSFPSKVMVYLAHGLRVVTAQLPVLTRSRVDELLYYYKENTPKSIAKAIEECVTDTSCKDASDVLDALDREFVQQIKKLVQSV